MGEGRVNPRYLAYCRDHGRTPEEMAAFDDKRHPHACMMGFILWSGSKMREFFPASRKRNLITQQDRTEYDAWLG